MISSVLFVTSFNKQLFDASGKAMCRSFIDSGSVGRLMVVTEGMSGDEVPDSDSISVHPIENMKDLRKWEIKNRDIIPKDLGGTAVCRCRGNPPPKSKKHGMYCPNKWFNRYASRWFRKVVSLVDAMRMGGAEVIIWADCDSVFTKPITDEVILEALKGKAIGYMKSKQRQVIESGLLVFHGPRGGFELIESVFVRYMSGKFRFDERWDDGFQWQKALEVDPELRRISIDMATKASGHADVLPHTIFGSYMEHHKGKHSRILKLRT